MAWASQARVCSGDGAQSHVFSLKTRGCIREGREILETACM